MREIVLDTETTGLDPKTGDRLIEVACVEIMNRVPTGREYHVFINPERDVPPEAVKVHGLTREFLADKPVFAKVVDGFLEFIAEAPLVIHNASFDVGFLNSELARLSKGDIAMSRVVDTLALARRRNPAGPNSLDALCKRFGVDNSKRTKHGALMDAHLLAEVYLELLGERQGAFALSRTETQGTVAATRRRRASVAPRSKPLPSRLSPEDEAAHLAFVTTLGPDAIWLKTGDMAKAKE